MLKKSLRYWNTLKHLRPGQIYHRLRKRLGLTCGVGCRATFRFDRPRIHAIAAIGRLDFDPVFLARFPAADLMEDKVLFLHRENKMDWFGSWRFEKETPLWNFNLHYFEYLFSLLSQYKKSGEKRWLNKARECILGWMEKNPPARGGAGWEPYTLAVRLTNWLGFYTWAGEWFASEPVFEARFLESIYAQYVYLARHVEKDLLANHYFEDLKALILCALFFGNDDALAAVMKEFKKQCREQILGDGMHFELSPMYHKVMLEGMLRVSVALRAAGRADDEIESYLQPMLNAAFSFENGLKRLPLFNDCGDNVAKSLEALLAAAKAHFHLTPRFCSQFPESGYYIFRRDDWTLIVDAGQPGPSYAPGHAHCDAMSFELFKAGKPVLVNCGTYAYQCAERGFFRSTAAHNTVMRDGVEQSDCWGSFRVAKRAKVEVNEVSDQNITMTMTDCQGGFIQRTMTIATDGITITDRAEGKLVSYLHWLDQEALTCENVAGEAQAFPSPYAPAFGLKQNCTTTQFTNHGRICVRLLWQEA